jgi:DNA mismatch repair protein MutS2
MDLVEAKNALTDLDTEEREEIRRILTQLIEALRQGLPALRGSCHVLGHFDAWAGIARWSLRWKGSLPLVVEDASHLRLVGARHPLLCRALGSLESVVALNLDMDPDLRCLVVSGPNMGGKSVLLRTVGTTVVLASCGLPVLAREGTEIPLVDDVLVDIGDEQSMESDLSTFAAHLRNLREMDKRAGRRTLLLIDELGSGTDPQEGAALGLSLLDALHRRGGFIVVTTHMGAFKDFAAQTPGAGNASMEFDRKTLRPKFVFLPGVPGRSHAFEVASMQGWPEGRMREASRRLQESTRHADALLRELEDMRETLLHQEEEVSKKHAEAESIRSRYDSLAQRLKERLDKIRMEKSLEEDQLLRELRELRSKLQLSLDQIKEEQPVAPEKGRDVLRKTDSTLRKRRRRRVPRRTRRPKIPREELAPGREVWCEELRANVKLESITPKGDKAWVWAGAIRMEVPVGSLCQPTERETANEPGAARDWIDIRSSQPPPGELDLRGLDREECMRQLDLYLDRALVSGLQRVTIIHGIGKGILKEQVVAYLRTLSHVDTFRPGEPGEGGTGVTIAFLREPKGDRS